MKKKQVIPMRTASTFLSFVMLVTGFVLPLSDISALTAYADELPKGFTAIASAQDLELIRNDPFGKFILTEDIDLSETRRGGELDSGCGWTPIEKFAGTLDGNGHSISDMTIYGSVRNAGFIALNYGTITDVHIKDANIEITPDLTSNVCCGALCAYSTHDVELCSATGTVRAAVLCGSNNANDFSMGGLIGRSEVRIDRSYSAADVEYCAYMASGDTAPRMSLHIGGVAGVAACFNCYNTGTIRKVSCRSFFDINGDFTDCTLTDKLLHVGGICAGGSCERCVNFADGGITGYETNNAFYCYCAEKTFGYYGNRGSSIPITSNPEPIYNGLDPAVWENIKGKLQLIENSELPPVGMIFETRPEKVSFSPNEPFECDGVLLVTYENGSTKQVTVTREMTSGYDLSAEGEQTVTVSYRGFTLYYTITVSAVHATGILLDKYSMELNRGQSMQLTATLTPVNVTSEKISWSSSDQSVAVVDENGLVTAVSSGIADITVQTKNGLKAVCRLNAYVEANSMWFDTKSTTVNVGETINIAPSFDPPDAAPKLHWAVVSSDSANCVVVDQQGNVTGMTPGGNAEIKCSMVRSGILDPNLQFVVPPYASYKISVTAHTTDIALSNEKLNVTVSQQFEISCRALPEKMTDELSVSYTGNLFTEVERSISGNSGYIRLIADRAGKSVVTFSSSNGMEKSCEVTVDDPDIADAVFTPEYKKTLYNGKEKTPSVSGTYNGEYLQQGNDYTVSYNNNVNVGVGSITIKGINKYVGSQTLKFVIYDISSCSMTLGNDFYIYDGLEKRPSVTLYDNDHYLKEGTDYRVSYSNNVNAGTAYATVTGINDYTGTKTMTFTISRENRVDLSSCDITLDPTSFIYDGGEKRAAIIAYNGHTPLVKDRDFTVTYHDNIKIGTARAVVMGIGSYTGTRELNYSITAAPQKDISGCTAMLSQASFEYDGQEKRPDVQVKNNALVLSNGTDYSVTYSNNVNVGTATATVTGIGSYTGTMNLSFTIKKKPEPQPDSDTDSEPQPKQESFIWGVDNWNFLNSSYKGHFTADTYRSQINDTYKDILAQNLTNSEYQTIFRGTKYSGAWLDETFGGSCYGMSSTTLLAKQGFFPFEEYQPNAKTLHDLDYPAKNGITYPSYTKNVSSLITYYQMLQVKSVTQQKYKTYPKRSNADNIKEIMTLLDSNDTVLLGFRKDGWGGHAILAYGYEFGSYTKNGTSYQGRIKICDPNSSTTNDENFYIYFTTPTYDWEIPAYSSGNIKSKSGAVFNYVGANIDEINMGGYLSGSMGNSSASFVARMDVYSVSKERSVSKVQANENGSYVMMNNAPGDIEEDYSYVLGGETQGVIGYNLYDSNAAYRVFQDGGQPLELSITYESCMMTGGSQSGRSVTFDKKGSVEVKGESSDFSMSITHNNESPTDWFSVSVSGNASSASLTVSGNGWIISGDSLENVSVSTNNKYSSASTEFSTMYDSALIYELDQNTIGIAVDADSNGTYETTIKPDPTTEPITPPVEQEIGLSGELDGDGNITANDALMILRSSVGLADLTPKQTVLADVDADGNITANDALDVLRYSVGLGSGGKVGRKVSAS